MRKAPFYGKGIAFPFRINPATGGVVMTEGIGDSISVALQYLSDRWTIREDVNPQANHIAEAIAHILLTRPTEHDTLPEFGSDIFTILFEPNTEQFQVLANHYFSWSTIRWEKRARIPEQGGMTWTFEGPLVDQGRLPVIARVNFIQQQADGNLINPFVTPLEAKNQEYQPGDTDAAGHDWASRYRGQIVYDIGGTRFIRPRVAKPVLPAKDDQFYEVKHGDTWLLISWELYGDIRFHWLLTQIAVSDAAADGASRDAMDTLGDPVPGTVLRVPSRTRMLMEVS